VQFHLQRADTALKVGVEERAVYESSGALRDMVEQSQMLALHDGKRQAVSTESDPNEKEGLQRRWQHTEGLEMLRARAVQRRGQPRTR